MNTHHACPRAEFGPMLLFRLPEYQRAEEMFVFDAIDALSRARGGIVAEIQREPRAHVGTTQITLEDGGTVELKSKEIAMPISIKDADVVAFDLEPLLVSLDGAAEKHHEQLTDYFLSSLETITGATGNQVDASGKSYFEYMYEMYEKVELSFDDDGKISSSYAMVTHPDTAERMEKSRAEMTKEEEQKLAKLLERKREEYFARRRRRKLS
jgi:hypothetical protein